MKDYLFVTHLSAIDYFLKFINNMLRNLYILININEIKRNPQCVKSPFWHLWLSLVHKANFFVSRPDICFTCQKWFIGTPWTQNWFVLKNKLVPTRSNRGHKFKEVNLLNCSVVVIFIGQGGHMIYKNFRRKKINSTIPFWYRYRN